ncbi:hypothetical protein IscW_ISCW020019 [Ixodes scapularis]|uniref:Uncharacterized protein n=1 Tax=Ixodes scapularis TaxID=6945 RepID=B7Q235_IXOSC|nr:hypothetical protein IscW_ISCW020019 [Ixodes scapularis]|eukprot:XP_002410394.1 hypothetical protein IscW_ISCW020019 [Ixodes scapularis]
MDNGLRIYNVDPLSEKAHLVLIWDDLSKRFVMEFTFPSPVLAVRLRRDKIFVVSRRQIHVMSFLNKPSKLFSCDTWDNPLDFNLLWTADECRNVFGLVAAAGHHDHG